MAVSPEKPAGATGEILEGTGIGTSGGDTFVIKVLESDTDYFSPVQEDTGDGDLSPSFENSGFLYGQGSIRGVMVAGQEVGLENLVAAGNPITFTFHYGATIKHTVTAIVERIRFRWRRNSPYTALSMLYRCTETSASSIENTTSGG
jgi:hypothetical protein